MKRLLKYIIAAGVFLLPLASMLVRAQEGDDPTQRTLPDNAPVVHAKFIPDSIAIGDVFDLEVEVSMDIMQIVGFPEFNDGKIGEYIEIVKEYDIDTVIRDGRNLTLRKKYLLQTFEEGYFGFGRYPMLYVDKNITDTIWSVDSLLLKIGTFDIDTASQTIYDIKPPIHTGLKIGEISGYTMWGLLALAVLCAIIWYIFTRRKNLNLLGKPKPIEPPHVIAIKSLEAVHNQKLWQNNKHKLYYTRITDILREYLEGRYGIKAMEMTSDEIIGAMSERGLSARNYENLSGILKTSDLVKFAKHIPDADHNENAYTQAYYFVEDTKPYEVEPATQQED